MVSWDQIVEGTREFAFGDQERDLEMWHLSAGLQVQEIIKQMEDIQEINRQGMVVEDIGGGKKERKNNTQVADWPWLVVSLGKEKEERQ